MPIAIDSNSKPDTVLLLLPAGAGAAALAADVSQNRTALTNNTTYVSEANSARTAIDAPREVAIVVDVTSLDSGVLAQLGNGGGYSWRVRVTGSGDAEVAEGGLLLATVGLPSLGLFAQRYLISWSEHQDTGGLVRSELAVYSIDTDEWAHAQVTHFAGTASATDTLTIGAAFGGASAFSGGVAAFHAVRVGRRYHSGAEALEDWVAATTPPTMTQVRRGAPLVPDRASLADLAADGAYCGPAHLWAGHAFEQSDRRLVSPLVNVRVRDPMRLTYDAPSSATTEAWCRLAPGSTTMYLLTPYLFYRPVPLKVNRARVRLHVRQTIEVGSDTAEVRYRVYSIAGMPVVGEPVPALSYRRTAQATCDNHHGAAPAGEWLDLGELALEVDGWAMTWIAVGVEFDLDSPLVGDTRAYINAVTVEPYAVAQGGGLDIVNP